MSPYCITLANNLNLSFTQGWVILNLTPNITLGCTVINLTLLYSFELKVLSANTTGLSQFYREITENKLCFHAIRPEATYRKMTNFGHKLFGLYKYKKLKSSEARREELRHSAWNRNLFSFPSRSCPGPDMPAAVWYMSPASPYASCICLHITLQSASSLKMSQWQLAWWHPAPSALMTEGVGPKSTYMHKKAEQSGWFTVRFLSSATAVNSGVSQYRCFHLPVACKDRRGITIVLLDTLPFTGHRSSLANSQINIFKATQATE